MKRDPDAQRLIDLLTPIAAGLRIEHGPDDPCLFMLSRFIHLLYTGEIRGRGSKATGGKQRRIKARLANGEPVTLDASVLERSED